MLIVLWEVSGWVAGADDGLFTINIHKDGIMNDSMALFGNQC